MLIIFNNQPIFHKLIKYQPGTDNIVPDYLSRVNKEKILQDRNDSNDTC
uniref:Uncharacterized protein n=1 Tax=Parastrongyloides trichosuri TaxID=131310 RepID=A0A0N5A7G2_PARTI